MPYVSITGLCLSSPLQMPLFFWHATRSMKQARLAEGNLHAEVHYRAGYHHTLSIWTSEAAMRAYLTRGAHRSAILSFPRFAGGRTIGFRTETPPDWQEAHAIWLRDAREVGK